MPKILTWDCKAVVSSLAELVLMETLTQESEDVLYRRLIGELDMPIASSMSEYQIVNLLRQVLREKMGEERFNAMTIMGSVEGQKAAADMFEGIVESYLRNHNIRFQTENELRSMKSAKGPRLTYSQAQSWRKTSTVDSQGRTLFSGLCCLCGNSCECPFKPLVGREGPKCRDCFSNLTPDFLSLDDVYINGVKVTWIDCKCYYGSGCMGIHGKTSLQRVSVDYSNKWGPGAVIFAFGFCESFELDGVLLLDDSNLDKTTLETLLENAPFRQLRKSNMSEKGI